MSCLSQPSDHHISTRPKLTLQTTSLPRTFGSSTTGLSLSFAAAGASPTVRNTFINAYDVASPSSATASPSKITAPASTITSTSTSSTSNHRFNNSKPISPYIHHPPTNHPFSYRPYQIPLGVRSILRNSPLEPSRLRSGSISAGTSGPSGSRRVFFPAKKTVSYRYPLEEEIHTEQYTAQHLDLLGEAVLQAPAPVPVPAPVSDSIDSDSDSGCASLSETSTSDEGSADETGVRGTSLSKIERKKRRSMGVERQVRAVALLDGLESDYSSTPQTPRQGRAKRRREWKWTLGPLGPEDQNVKDSSLPTDDKAEPQSGP
ncbi:hypothetical protein N7448_001193 [Penicillium atrosanguineum]|uniref:Uncharacterized protein n=1 Tax=Penicillium atrosanguineum TaxID=1132637 RepID=A0A9W9U851_9EURO|nr:NADH ubiquinone oxidoreductase F subunit [Penicillium atrosanguineum]KAJ5133785.1 hypothetical protein N7526_005150 [Penicillium atrosanguineum]KAJ5149615.1 hypothetical protein N7448_001193 [Penicillium atrosanguineum]KAJ5304930.1 NADH ubiquinone oxidoreductase F subunit [Penicillium atrosanguineum]KAJ5324395.1 hypothetical protein N7476_002995 [Penicillium atrosanguineum]